MYAYRFKIWVDDNEDFLREFEFRTSSTFIEFHELLKKSAGLKGNELASFFVCDPVWRKKKEITLINMDAEFAMDLDEEDDDRRTPVKNRIPVVEMANVKISSVIDDPHQRMMYVYDFINPKTFYIELVKIKKSSPDIVYPLIAVASGEITVAPFPTVGAIPDDEEIALEDEFDDIDGDSELDDGEFTSESAEDSQAW